MLYDVETHFLIMGFLFVSVIVQIVFIVQKLLGVLTWPWWKVLCVFEFYGSLWLLGVVICAGIALVMAIMRLVKGKAFLKYW